MRLGQERRRFVAGELFIFTQKFRVFISFAKGLLDNRDTILRCSGRKDKGGSGDSERAPQDDQFALFIGLGKAFKLGKMFELGMLVALGNFKDRMKVHQPAFEPIPVPLRNRVGGSRPSIDLTAHQRLVDFGPGIAGDELWLFETENVSEEATFIVGGKAHGLASDSDSGGRREFLYAAQARLLSAQKNRMVRTIG